MTTPFPQSMDFAGHNEPVRIECDIFDLVVEGEIPAEINGCWYRSIPDPQYPPLPGTDVFISGDGMVSVFNFENGHVDFKMKYVMTERLKNDRAARRSLYGVYRNPFTDDPSVAGQGRGVANTTPVYHGGKLLALKEDSRAMELDPVTLATIGEWDFDGKLKSQTMTAHTRLDPDTGELYFYGYEAGGLATTDISYCIADKDGNLISEQWFQAPYCAMMHDFAISKEHAIFPVFPTVCEMETLKAGGSHWAWDPSRNTYVGIMPRNGKVSEMRWFEGPPCFSYHMMNAFTEGNLVHMDLCLADVNMFPFIQEAGGVNVNPKDANGRLARWTFDLSSDANSWTETVLGPDGDLPRIADKDMLKNYEIGYYLHFNPQCGSPILSGPVGAGFNCLSRINLNSGELKSFSIPGTTLQEPVHIKSSQAQHEGYLLLVCDQHEKNLAEVLLLEAEHVDKGPVAIIKMPMRFRCGVHGNWVPADAFQNQDL
ncbi:carotenoid oxygenase family protein [Gammaproteobacteria bacterium]|nr:carotenoid oxygenase family protein [Gammaproteobacteria bacterium]